ncbi:hypothetical protein [Nocardioides sediminis]|uniref:hypothetical protein n=1 Tax=Nocardioides sediminis TaxID=433648 RepID=UPI00131F091C|nr:hypothetical protein [Nocardioides sediminis]
MVATRWAARAAAACAVGFMAMGGTAAADTTRYDDPIGDSTEVDVSRVRVVHRDAVTVRVRSAVPLAAGQLYTFWIQTGRGAGRTYHVAFRANSDFEDRLGVVRPFGRHPTRFVECPGVRARADIFSDAPVAIRVPRSCLGEPGRVRVAVRFADETTGAADWAPERRTFGPWVTR